MDWNRVEGNWKQMKGKVKEKWGQLTDDDLDAIDGRREQLEGKIQQRYGMARTGRVGTLTTGSLRNAGDVLRCCGSLPGLVVRAFLW